MEPKYFPNLILKLCLSALVLTMTQCKNTPTQQDSSAIAPEQKSEADLGGLYQYYHASPQTLEQRDENTLIEYAADHNIEAQRTQSGVYIQVLEEGAGPQIKWGDPISVHYRGYFLDGKEFDSSYSRGEPINFRVGSMVAGWNEALPYLKVGTKATFLIPSHMGYGPKGFPGFIGPNKNIIFDIHVLPEDAPAG